MLLLHAVASECIEFVNFAIHDLYVLSKLLPVVFKFLQAHLQGSSLVVTLQHFLLCLGDANLANFILLLKVNDQFVLTLNHSLVLIDHLLSLLGLLLVLGLHACAHVIQSAQLLIQASDFVVLDDAKLVQLVDLLLSVSSLALVALKHREQTVDALVARLAQVLHHTLAHLYLLLVLFKLGRDLF